MMWIEAARDLGFTTLLICDRVRRRSSVPRYFFDYEDDEFYRDEDGIECTDLARARREATLSLSEMARYAIPADGGSKTVSMTVRDAAGESVYTATLTFAGHQLSSVTSS
jgi:hypothetical protein